jgi:Domain of unknown function (DUF6883)
MKLPNAERAFVDIAKLRDYSLNAEHKEGTHKARVFAAALGLGPGNAEWLRAKLLNIARSEDCRLGRKTDYGQRYLIDSELSHERKSAQIRSVWIIRKGENSPRLITCYVV